MHLPTLKPAFCVAQPLQCQSCISANYGGKKNKKEYLAEVNYLWYLPVLYVIASEIVYFIIV